MKRIGKILRKLGEAFYVSRKNRKPIAMSYGRVPEDILENSDLIIEWITKAI